MIDTLFALGIGLITGLFLAMLGVAVPAPSSVAGVAGILGLTLGYLAVGGMR